MPKDSFLQNHFPAVCDRGIQNLRTFCQAGPYTSSAMSGKPAVAQVLHARSAHLNSLASVLDHGTSLSKRPASHKPYNP